MKAFRWRSLVTPIVAIGVLLLVWLAPGQINGVVNADADRTIQETAARLMVFAAAFLLLLGFLSLVLRRAWLAGLRLLVGIGLVVSPWTLGHAAEPLPTLILVAGGVAVVAVAAFDLYRDVRHEGESLSHMS